MVIEEIDWIMVTYLLHWINTLMYIWLGSSFKWATDVRLFVSLFIYTLHLFSCLLV